MVVNDSIVVGQVNTMTVKYINETRILQLLYWEGELTQTELKRRLRLSPPTVIQALQMFRRMGLVVDGTEMESSGGRKPRKIAFNYDACHSVGLEIRRGSVEILITNLRGTVVSKTTQNCQFKNTAAYWRTLNQYVNEAVKQAPQVNMVLGIGIAFPGEVSFKDEMIERAVVLGLSKVPLDNIRKHFDYDIYIENGANSAGFGAVWRNKEIKDVVYVIVTDDGVAGTIILNNHIFRGSGKAGAFGHMTLDPNGKRCFCGAKGCWSAYGALSNLTSDTQGDLDLFFQRLNEKDPASLKAWDTYLDYFALALHNLVLSLDLDIIIGGKLVKYLPPYLEILQEKMKAYPSLSDEAPNIRLDNIDENTLAAGAALIFVDRLLSGRLDFKEKFPDRIEDETLSKEII